MKTILLHVQDDRSLGNHLQAALSLAHAFSAHLTFLHITPIEARGVRRRRAHEGRNGRARAGRGAILQQVEEQLAGEDVAWDNRQVTGPVASVIVKQAALADLLVTGRESHLGLARTATQIGLIGDPLHRCRTPLQIPLIDGAVVDPAKPALIAWNGSFEAANAVRSSIDSCGSPPEFSWSGCVRPARRISATPSC